MKQLIKLTESDLHKIVENSVKKVLREAKFPKHPQSFNSKEDMTQYRDMYAPSNIYAHGSTEDEVYNAPWGNGPYVPYDNRAYGAAEDGIYDFNQGMKHKLATKGGQMSQDWDDMMSDYENQDRWNRDDLEKAYKERRDSDPFGNDYPYNRLR